MPKSTPKKVGTCTYCGETKPLTKDHVVPRCLFPKPLPSFMVTVPACDDCNSEKANHDDYLRDILVVDADTAKSKGAQGLLEGPLLRAAKRNQSKVIKAAKAQGKMEAVHSPSGIYLGHAFSFPLEGDRVNHIFSLIVRGLYFKTTKLLLPQDCKLDVRRLTAAEFYQGWDELKRIGYNGPYRLGDDVFTCIFIYAQEEPAVSMWWMWFFDSICIFVTTEPSTGIPATM